MQPHTSDHLIARLKYKYIRCSKCGGQHLRLGVRWSCSPLKADDAARKIKPNWSGRLRSLILLCSRQFFVTLSFLRGLLLFACSASTRYAVSLELCTDRELFSDISSVSAVYTGGFFILKHIPSAFNDITDRFIACPLKKKKKKKHITNSSVLIAFKNWLPSVLGNHFRDNTHISWSAWPCILYTLSSRMR